MGSLRIEITSSGSFQRYHSGWQSREQQERLPTRVARITKQHFSDIRAECVQQQALFEDPDFPAANRSIYYSYDPGVQFKWMRPTVCVRESVTRSCSVLALTLTCL